MRKVHTERTDCQSMGRSKKIRGEKGEVRGDFKWGGGVKNGNIGKKKKNAI